MSDGIVTRHPARELSPEEHQSRRDLCRQIEERIKTSIESGRRAMWDMAHGLYDFNEECGWTAHGFKRKTECWDSYGLS